MLPASHSALSSLADDPTRRFRLPAWGLSLVLHVGLIVVLGLLMVATPVAPRGPSDEPAREVGLVVAHTSPRGETYYESEGETLSQPTSSARASAASLVGESSPVSTQPSLPKGRDIIGVGASGEGGAAGAGDLTQGPAQPRGVSGGRARTRVFDIEAEGHKFVYVFDHSTSMSGSGGRSLLRAAQNELVASLANLNETHQFQIIFYNDQVQMFALTGVAGRLVFGTPQNKAIAERFVRGITATGGTEHLAPLRRALAMQPDVIFFLTDADEPGLSDAQLTDIRRSNQGTSINTIEFGVGASRQGGNFLARLARENGGQYRYFDVSQGLPTGQ